MIKVRRPIIYKDYIGWETFEVDANPCLQEIWQENGWGTTEEKAIKNTIECLKYEIQTAESEKEKTMVRGFCKRLRDYLKGKK